MLNVLNLYSLLITFSPILIYGQNMLRIDLYFNRQHFQSFNDFPLPPPLTKSTPQVQILQPPLGILLIIKQQL